MESIRGETGPSLSAAPVATDALGRKLPEFDETGPRRAGKFVGVFYYLWHGYHGEQVYDITALLEKNPQNPEWGPPLAYHYWGQPEAGYYRADDPWVIRRNLQMLSDADVDFIFFDVTNGPVYLDAVTQVCEMSLAMRKQGTKTPDICFLTNTHSGRVMTELHETFYTAGTFEELWFCWQGKPLMMGDKNDPELSAEAASFFTIKYSWAHTEAEREPDHWQWLDETPQRYGWCESPGVPEQISVSVAHHPLNPYGQSYIGGAQPPVDETYRSVFTGQGLQFEEQWKRALEVDPAVVMVTQWNEWIAMRFIWEQGPGQFGGRPIEDGDSYFVDVFNEEYNRDVEPMKGGHTDNHYYLLAANVRRFKGMDDPQPLRAAKTIAIDSDFSEWSEVTPVYEDSHGDTLHRNWPGYDPNTRYVNRTGRNDIIESRVAYDDDYLYFYVKTADDLTPHTGLHWMHLYVDADRDKATGWEGYDYAVNIEVADDRKTFLSRYGTSGWETVASIDYRYSGNELELAVPRFRIGQEKEIEFEFKWADHVQTLYDIEEFFVSGDTAPTRRSNYLFRTR